MFISATRLRVRKWQYLPGFFWFSFLSVRQARRAEGNRGAWLHSQRGLVFWTITVWQDEAAMRAFRNHGAHARVMPRLRDWCDEATYAHWMQEGAEPPELDAAYERLVREGIVSHVKHPSRDHASRAFAPPGK